MSDSPFVAEVTADNFETEVLARSNDVPVLVDFWAAWCQPCQMLMPILTSLAETYGGKIFLAKVNSDEQQALATQYGVRSLPTVKLFRHGQPVDEFMGALPEGQVREFIDKHLDKPSDPLRQQARDAMDSGEFEAAIELLNQALSVDDGNPEILLEKAQLSLALGNMQEAMSIVESLPLAQRDSDEAKRIKAAATFAAAVDKSVGPAELELRIEQNANDSDARYQRACRAVLQGQYESALDDLLHLVRTDRAYKDGVGQTGMLAIFDLLEGGDLVNRYRRQMFNALH